MAILCLLNTNLVNSFYLNFSSNFCYVYINYLLCKYFSLASLAVYKDKYAREAAKKKLHIFLMATPLKPYPVGFFFLLHFWS